MNAYYLHKPDGTPTDLSTCGVCGKLARGATNFDISERCCTCYDCGLPLSGDERRFANTCLYHRACDDKRRTEREAARLDKAELVSDYDGPVYADGYGGGSYGEAYFADIDEFAEAAEDALEEGVHLPDFVHCCKSRPVAGLDLGRILESHCEDAFEDAFDHLNGVDELQTAVDAFNTLNAGVLSWEPDYSRKVRVTGGTPGAEGEQG